MIPASTLAELERLEGLATAGPWVVWRSHEGRTNVSQDKEWNFVCECGVAGDNKVREDAEFIAVLRNHAKALIASARLVEEMAAALKALANAADDVGVKFFDTDTMEPEVDAMQSATTTARNLLAKVQLERNLSCSTDPGFAERMRRDA